MMRSILPTTWLGSHWRQSVSLIAVALGLLMVVPGCSSDENVVIQPGEDYQLSESEEANKKAEMEARMGGGDQDG